MKTADAMLDIRYRPGPGRVMLTGTQALIRLLLTQRRRDAAAGLNTAGFLSGYRGSPLGAVDIQAHAAAAVLAAEGIVFRPGVNEDLAMTAVWGSQIVPLFPGATHDGVFAMWYGKGPGVDRSGDALKHANYAGTTRHGGVLVVAGDDHAAKSSTIAHQSEPALIAAGVPVLAPGSVAEILELGLLGWAASRHAGLYVGFKTVEEIIDCTASVEAGLDVAITLPEIDPDSVAMRLHEPVLAQEARVLGLRRPALMDFVAANRINRIVEPAPGARLGIVTAGKSFLDVAQARADLGLDFARLLKLGMTWPVEPGIVRDFARGLEEIVVVEEKAPVIEDQLRAILYGMADAPRIVGKRDETGATLFHAESDLAAADVTLGLGRRAQRMVPDEARGAALARLAATMEAGRALDFGAHRVPHFCAGCPHNTSTKVPAGSRAMAGIGCHFMATWMDRATDVYSHMGGEGAAWIGQAPFTTERHVFANIGDGTYHHSGLLAIRAAVAAGVNITYRVLFNDAVAMTGGQHVDGPLSVPQITRELAAEGVKRIEVVTDEPEKYQGVADLAPGVAVSHRRELDAIQRAIREVAGVTAIVYDQTCATEKRRRRKRGTMADPAKRAFINPRVCEGCGDCSRVSNCIAVVPVDTPFGRKRAIDQSACNKDFSCVEGFCPSFVTVHGGGLRPPEATRTAPPGDLPEPALPPGEWDMVVAGIGGTGVVTIGALLGMAAHLDGTPVSVVDVLGLAQKGGAVVSHLRFGAASGTGQALRVPAGRADLLLGCDALVAGERETLDCLSDKTRAVVNLHETITGEFTRNPAASLPMARLRQSLARRVGEAHLDTIEATAIATALMGDAIAANLFLLGYAWQRGLVPVSRAAIARAVEMNGQAVALNLAAFAWGRAAAHDRAAVEAAAPAREVAPEGFDALFDLLRDDLAAYQNRRYAARFAEAVEAVRAAERAVRPGSTALAETAARTLHRLMAYKDEYEVARLHSLPAFRAALERTFTDTGDIRLHLAPPLLARRDKVTGLPQKREYGPWMLKALAALAPLKVLRGTVLDPFGHSAERRAERALIGRYEATLRRIAAALDEGNFAAALELAAIPAEIRGFGPVKARSLAAVGAHWAEREAAFIAPPAAAQHLPAAAAE